MTKQERELRAQAELIKAEARNLVGEDKIEEAKAKAKEAQALMEKAELMAQLEAEEIAKEPLTPEKKDRAEIEANYRASFFKALRGRKLTADDRENIEVCMQDLRAATWQQMTARMAAYWYLRTFRRQLTSIRGSFRSCSRLSMLFRFPHFREVAYLKKSRQ